MERRVLLTTGLVGTASVGITAAALAKAEAPWWSVLLGVLAVVLVVLAALRVSLIELRVSLIKLRMTYRLVHQLMEQQYTGTFKGPCEVELTGPTEPVTPEPEPLKPKRWVRRKPPPDS